MQPGLWVGPEIKPGELSGFVFGDKHGHSFVDISTAVAPNAMTRCSPPVRSFQASSISLLGSPTKGGKVKGRYSLRLEFYFSVASNAAEMSVGGTSLLTVAIFAASEHWSYLNPTLSDREANTRLGVFPGALYRQRLRLDVQTHKGDKQSDGYQPRDQEPPRSQS